MAKAYYVYLLASQRNGTLYTGVTGDLLRRVLQHRTAQGGQFTRRYRVTRLVHIEAFEDVRDAIAREKAIKKWRRSWKIDLIERDNPAWDDLFGQLNG